MHFHGWRGTTLINSHTNPQQTTLTCQLWLVNELNDLITEVIGKWLTFLGHTPKPWIMKYHKGHITRSHMIGSHDRSHDRSHDIGKSTDRRSHDKGQRTVNPIMKWYSQSHANNIGLFYLQGYSILLWLTCVWGRGWERCDAGGKGRGTEEVGGWKQTNHVK